MPKKFAIPLVVVFVLYVAVSIFPTVSFYSYVTDASRHMAPERNWMEDRISYVSVPKDMIRNSEYVRSITELVQNLADSLTTEYSVAHNLPEGFAPYELKEFLQADLADTANIQVLLLLDMRLDCSCDESKDSFWHLQYTINPKTLTTQVVTDAVRPWRTYVPQYRVSVS